jgi:hypothetical protein
MQNVHGKIPRSLILNPITLPLKLVAIRNSSVIVVLKGFLVTSHPLYLYLPNVLTDASSVQYISFPVALLNQSFPTIPCVDGVVPV